jgi:cytochrome c
MRRSVLSLALLLTACGPRRTEIATAGNPALGAEDLFRVGCGSCHTIPGIVGAHGKVGPSLEGVASRSYVAGQLFNQPSNLEHWIQHPHAVHPDTLMPEMGLTVAESRDIAAYLYSLN